MDADKDNEIPLTSSLNGSIINQLEKKDQQKRKTSPIIQTNKKQKPNIKNVIQPTGRDSQTPVPMGPPGPPITRKKDNNKTILQVQPLITTEIDSTVYQLLDDNNSRGFTIIPNLVGDNQPSGMTNNVSITKITTEESPMDDNE